MAKRVTCSFCGVPKWMQYRHYKENLMIHRVENITQLNRVYICKSCRVYRKPNDLKNTTEFRAFQREIQEVIKEFIARGWNNIEAEQICRSNIEAILSKNHIGPKQFKVIRDGHKIKGFVLLNIPFWHEVLVETGWKE